jgi:hypothetical protein
MDWLRDILKNLEVSRTLVVAIFIAALAMFTAPYVAPDYVPRLQKEFIPFLFGVMVLTGALLLIWCLAAAWSLSKSGFRRTTEALADTSLSEAESMILMVLGRTPTTPLNLEDIDYERASASRLEFHHLVGRLEAMGLVRTNEYDENLVSLTQSGRSRALQVHRDFKARGAA